MIHADLASCQRPLIPSETREAEGSDHWRPTDRRLQAAARRLADAAAQHVHYLSPWDDSTAVDTVDLLGCEAYSALQTDEHTDEGFPRWTVLMVLRTNGHSITVNDGARTFVPEAGDLVLFDLHTVHELDLPARAWPEDDGDALSPPHLEMLCRDFPFVCAHLDVERRPARAEAETMMLDVVAPALGLPA